METVTAAQSRPQPEPTPRPRQSWKVLAGAAAAVAVVAGVVGLASVGGGSTHTGPAVVDIQATDAGLNITGLDAVKPGYTRFSDTNTTDSDHALMIVKLHNGVTAHDMKAALESPDGIEALNKADFYGGVDDVPHHTTWAETVDLTPGTYVVLDHAEGHGEGNGAWFSEPGFYFPFTVADASATNAVKPKADAVITMRDFAYDMPATLPADGVVEFRNEGVQLHMGVLLKLNPGVTVDEAMQNLSDDTTLGTPLEFIGATSPGTTVSVEQHFEPGTYVIACLMPDMQRDGTPHAMEGMFSSFTVS
ncbi:MAG TPA: hypothetical protein VK461_10260 [Acidimicrobiales bacterium]|nr:hypothetical protein [Acidimicrobiales bacterium]